MTWWRRFGARGVFWRHFLRWAVINVPIWIEPAVLGTWSLLFLTWTSGRRAVMHNLKRILPRSSALANFFRCYRVLWNFAWTIADNVRFKEMRTVPDWSFDGWEHFEEMKSRGGAILLTAHMGSADLGAHLFSEISPEQRIVMVRAPEVDPQTRGFEEKHLADGLRIEFNTDGTDLAIQLLHALREGAIVAVQGDRVTPGIASLPVSLFGDLVPLPSGPFALALAARVPIYPLFVMRVGRRHYCLVTREAITIERTRDRSEDIAAAMSKWAQQLESTVAGAWWQWFNFEPLECGGPAAAFRNEHEAHP